MKILFLNKNARKPKSLSFYSLIVLVSIIFSIGFICAYIIFNTQENKDEMSIAPLVLEQEIKVAPTNQEVDLYISQIGELNARIIQLDAQSERIQEIMKGQILGKDKLPKLKKKKDKNVGGPFVNDNLSLGDIHKVLTHLLEKVEKREIGRASCRERG